ncbi:MAG: gliding motility-associated C-terminal domain-containing protein [Saprospiraceae bacterium]|nr:gliding motility-associated C-terminal domain-containing protein [Bacteroidia bacterium]NNE15448.1 gliding motility-associated C-terminal domain-containing protein [Saprospiraceae bacterium]NNL93182.1 gliding motility-associated C-terminal domain-containing protein [Saprospiraceae bacterium]
MKTITYYIIHLLFFFPILVIGQVEICDNGIDDDNDMLVDLNDDDCACEVIEPISLIPNPSFEDMNCCPRERSQLDCASMWIQASEPTTDYIHLCDWLGWDDFPPPRPFPDGEGIMGFRDGRVRSNNNEPEPYWKEYAGACLTSPLIAGETYRFQFDVGFVDPDKSPPIDITFFGTTDCQYLPFGLGNIAFGCPTNSPNWDNLGDVRVSGGLGNRWVNTFLEITPDKNYYAIAIGPDCAPVPTPISLYYFFDNLLLADFESFNLQISESQHPCSNDYILSVPFNPEFEYQWFLEGIALQGEIFSELSQNYGEGIYQVRIDDGYSCRVSKTFEYIIPVIDMPANVAICDGDVYEFGDLRISEEGMYLDTFKSIDNCDSIVALNLTVIGAKYDTLEVSILKGESFDYEGNSFTEEGNYPLTLISSLGCDSLVLLKLSHFNIYIPNVFSPNRDGQNDVFRPYAQDARIETVEMSIYDRWGNLVFKGTEWDGYKADGGVYTYVLNINFAFDKSKVFVGTVTVIK